LSAVSSGRGSLPDLPGWYGALATFLEPLGARWGQGGDRAAWRARRGLDVPRGEAWIHAASVGEASGVAPLVAAWRARHPQDSLIASALTPGGRAALSKLAGVRVTAPPYETPACARRSVGASGITRLLLLETEIWPAWLAASLEAGVKIAVANARLSDRGWPRYQKLRSWLAPLVSRLTAVAAQSEIDAGRWRELGVPPERVRVTGNTKYESAAALAPPTAAEREAARRRFGLDDSDTVCVWGSLRPGEEKWLALALREESVRHLVVPRHPEQWRGRELPGQESGRAIWLLELGVLLDAYRAGDLAVMGGTLGPYGGHNALEPAALGLPVLLGPSTQNLGDVARALEQAGGAARIKNLSFLQDGILRWGHDAKARSLAAAGARQVASTLVGAAGRVIDHLESRGFWS